MSQLVRELKRKRDEEARLAQRSPQPVFVATEGSQSIQVPQEVLTKAVTALNSLAGAVSLQAGDNITVNINGQTITISGPTPGAEAFLGLTDTPGTYVGEAGRVVKVNNMEDGLEFADAPGDSYTLPQATETELGGIKAKAVTTETSEVAIDPTTGKLFSNAPDEAANGLPAGGIAGQVPVKQSATDYDVAWETISGGGGSITSIWGVL